MKRAAKCVLALSALIVAVGFVGAPAAEAWGCKGHQTVAALAEKHLTADAKKMFEDLLTQNPIDPTLKRYCGNTITNVFEDSATWADDERGRDASTAGWHFVDIPLGATPAQGPATKYCDSTGCVLTAINAQLAILKEKTQSGTNRANALRFIIHFVGDLHQPLHATTNSDRGGNCVPVQFFRRVPKSSGGSYTPNLHGIWDTDMVEREMEGASITDYAEFLNKEYKDSFTNWWQANVALETQLEAWAWEGHQHSLDVAYGALPVKIAAEPNVAVTKCTDDNDMGDRMLHLHESISDTYQNTSALVIEERLAQAGIRLANILNDAAKTN